MFICLSTNCCHPLVKLATPLQGWWLKFTGVWQKISARFARYLPPPWPKRWNCPWICVGDRKKRIRCLPFWEEDIIRKYVVIHKVSRGGIERINNQHVYRFLYTIFSHDIFILGRKAPYSLLLISYANYVQQYLQTIRMKKNWRKKNVWCSDSSRYL